MLPALGSVAAQQANPMQNTKKLVHQFLDYAATHPDAIITYQASDMVLAGHSNAFYLSETNARSRAGGHFFMSNDEAFPSNNGAILTISQIIKSHHVIHGGSSNQSSLHQLQRSHPGPTRT